MTITDWILEFSLLILECVFFSHAHENGKLYFPLQTNKAKSRDQLLMSTKASRLAYSSE